MREGPIKKVLKQITSLKGVVTCTSIHFWEVAPKRLHGIIAIEVREEFENENEIRKKIHHFVETYMLSYEHLFIQIERKAKDEQHSHSSE